MKKILNSFSPFTQVLSNSMPYWIKSLFNSTSKAIIGFANGLLAIFAPAQIAIAAVGTIIILDAIYGYRVSRKYNHKAIESGKLKATVKKLVDAIVAICGAFIIDQFIIVSLSLHAVEFVAGIIAFVEFWSILESMSDLYPKWAVWKILRKVIKKKGEKYLDINLDNELPTDNKLDNESN